MNPDWGRRFAPQVEIQAYYEKVALEYNLDKQTTFNTQILEAAWDDSLMLWKLSTQDLKTGLSKTWTCHLLISATGRFSVPKTLDLPGRDQFKGREWHTVDWPKDPGLTGKKVGIIGTGPSAAQLIPKIHKDVGNLIVYQRSPSHCIPRKDFVVGPLRKWIFAHFPAVRKAYKWWLTKMVCKPPLIFSP